MVGHVLHQADGALRLGKHANKRVASVGDIITYTITLQNGSGQDLDSNWATDGIWIRDYTPAGFVYLKDSLNGTYFPYCGLGPVEFLGQRRIENLVYQTALP